MSAPGLDRLVPAADPVLARAGAAGERLLARARLLLFAALALIPVSWFVPGLGGGLRPWEIRAGTAICAVALGLAAVIDRWARRDELPAWFGVASGVFDVTLVSGALAVYAALGHPTAAVNSLITFDLYFLGVAASALRYDWRVCALATTAAVGEYVALCGWAAIQAASVPAATARDDYGAIAVPLIVARCTLLVLAGVLAATLVRRAGWLRVASVRDQLTGLTNRAYFDERLAEEWSRARRGDGSLAVLLVDVDHFKAVNDRFGHPGGDEVLRAVAGALRTQARASDVLARYGGEEFALLLVGADARAAMARAEALRVAVETLAIPGLPPAVHERVRLTVSAGVALSDEVGEVATLVHRADARLYAAKSAGRNQVVGPSAADGVADGVTPTADVPRSHPVQQLPHRV